MTSRSILRNFYLYSMKKNNKCPIMQIYSVIFKIHLYFLKFKGNDLLDKIEYKFPVETVWQRSRLLVWISFRHYFLNLNLE